MTYHILTRQLARARGSKRELEGARDRGGEEILSYQRTCDCRDIEAVSMESKAVLNPILILWTQEAIEADKLIIILKSSCHFSNISENVHPELSPQYQNGNQKQLWIPQKLPLHTLLQHHLLKKCTDATVSPLSSCSSRR